MPGEPKRNTDGEDENAVRITPECERSRANKRQGEAAEAKQQAAKNPNLGAGR